jgi:uroporphyrinogen III methyltransferase/synthase
MVVRLKGGDPFVFGRGGEEALFLREHGIPFEVVPGVTAGIAGPAYAGIPVTHRGLTSTLALVTGHEDPAKPESDIDWSRLAMGVGTIVFYMGVKNLPHIVSQLLKHGRPKDTPAAVIRCGTLPGQQTVTGTLADIVQKSAAIKPPAITVVGEVARLREALSWFERRPLFGRRIVVTRSREQASELTAQLEDLGADVIELPTIKIVPPDDFGPLDGAIRDAARFHWIIFTSANGVRSFFDRCRELRLDVRSLKGPRLCAIGPGTTAALEARLLRVDLQPKRFVAEEIVEEFKRIAGEARLARRRRGLATSKPCHPLRILLPRTDIARSLLPDELRALGAEVTEVQAYLTRTADPPEPQLLARLSEEPVDYITFTSSSTVRNFVQCLGKERVAQIMSKARCASIGPITTQTARELGLAVAIEAKESTIRGLVEAILTGESAR